MVSFVLFFFSLSFTENKNNITYLVENVWRRTTFQDYEKKSFKKNHMF
jgi:hypothetical protein